MYPLRLTSADRYERLLVLLLLTLEMRGLRCELLNSAKKLRWHRQRIGRVDIPVLVKIARSSRGAGPTGHLLVWSEMVTWPPSEVGQAQNRQLSLLPTPARRPPSVDGNRAGTPISGVAPRVLSVVEGTAITTTAQTPVPFRPTPTRRGSEKARTVGSAGPSTQDLQVLNGL